MTIGRQRKSRFISSLLLPAAATLVLAAPALASGQVLTVGQGLGYQFNDIQPAVQAAGFEDLILVDPGNYSPFSVSGGDAAKNLVILGRGAIIDVPPGFTGITVAAIPLGSHLTLRGLTVSRIDPSSIDLDASGSDGELWIEECRFDGENQTQSGLVPFPTVLLKSCESVHFIDCYVKGMDGFVEEFRPRWASVGIDARGSDVSIWDSEIQGGDGRNGLSFWDSIIQAEDGKPAMVQQGEFSGAPVGLFISGSLLQGGDGGDGHASVDGCVNGANGAYALELINVLQAHEIDSMFLPGLAGSGAGMCSPGTAPFAPAIKGSLMTPLAGSAKSMDVGTPVTDGTQANMTFSGTAGDSVWLLVSTPRSTFTFLMARLGVLAVEPPFFQTLFLGVVPGGGSFGLSLPLPPLLAAGCDTRSFWLQPAFGASQQLGAPTCLTIVR